MASVRITFLASLQIAVAVQSSVAASRVGHVIQLSRAGRHRQALKIVDEAYSAGLSVHPAELTATIQACGKAKDLPSAMRALAFVEDDLRAGATPTIDHAKAFTSAVAVCGRLEKWREALDMLDRMRASRVPPDTRAYNAALAACTRVGQVRPMLETLLEMRAMNVPLDKASLTIAIDGCSRAGMTEKALELFELMGTAGRPEPDLICYNTIIAACARASAWERALRLLQQMQKAGISPSIESVSSAMAACSNAGQWELAGKLFARLGPMGLTPDVAAYSTAITALSRSGNYGRALRLFRRIRQQGLRRDTIAYNSLMHACALETRAFAPSHASRLRRLMRAENVSSNAITYSVLLQSLWRSPEVRPPPSNLRQPSPSNRRSSAEAS